MLKYYFIVGFLLLSWSFVLKSEYEEASEYKPMNIWVWVVNQTAARHNRWTGRTGAPCNPICCSSLGQVLERLKAAISSAAHPAEKLELEHPCRSWTLEGRTNLLLGWNPAQHHLIPAFSSPSPGPAECRKTHSCSTNTVSSSGKHHSQLPWSCCSGEKQEIAPRIEHTHTGCAQTHLCSSQHLHFISPQ